MDFLKSTILEKLVKDQNHSELKGLLRNLADHNMHDLILWAIERLIAIGSEGKPSGQDLIETTFADYSLSTLEQITKINKKCKTKEELLGLYLLG